MSKKVLFLYSFLFIYSPLLSNFINMCFFWMICRFFCRECFQKTTLYIYPICKFSFLLRKKLNKFTTHTNCTTGGYCVCTNIHIRLPIWLFDSSEVVLGDSELWGDYRMVSEAEERTECSVGFFSILRNSCN